ncbi:MAG: AAA-like domain-containing protein, partial [Elainellaceae cyanobacterium]
MEFEKEDAVQVANRAVLFSAGRSLSDVEIVILKGAWERLEYDQIAAQNQYATSYISNDVAPKLWRLLTDALGQKVRKSNFRAALRQVWENKAIEATPSIQANVKQVMPSLISIENHPGHAQPSSQEKLFENFADFVEDGSYIPRPPVEQICYKTVLKSGSLLRIKAPKQMGKTLLVNHLLCRVAGQNYRRVYLSLELTDKRKHLTDLSQFLRWSCLNVSRELGIAKQLDEYWSEDGLGAKVSCTTYFEQYILPYADSPLVLCLDDVDLLFPYPEVYEDFFGLLRSWYEKARSRAIWKNFRLVIVHATDVYIRLNIHQSPFNVGVPVTLPDFTLEQAQRLAQTYQLKGSAEQVEPL